MIEIGGLEQFEALLDGWSEYTMAFHTYYINYSNPLVREGNHFDINDWALSEEKVFVSWEATELVVEEFKRNLLLFNNSSIEFTYLSRLNESIRHIEDSSIRYSYLRENENINLNPQDRQTGNAIFSGMLRLALCVSRLQLTAMNSLTVAQHPERFHYLLFDGSLVGRPKKVYQEPESEELTTLPGLSNTFQKLLLIRFLQRAGMFPKRLPHMSHKQELEFIGAITGLSYEGNLKKARPDVEKLFDRKLTPAQTKSRLDDLRAVKTVALGMELARVVADIERYESDCIKIIGNE